MQLSRPTLLPEVRHDLLGSRKAACPFKVPSNLISKPTSTFLNSIGTDPRRDTRGKVEYSYPLSSGREQAQLEELSWSTSTVVWSKAGSIYRTYTFPDQEQRVSQALFVYFDVATESLTESTVLDASVATESIHSQNDLTFGAYRPSPPASWTDEPLPLPTNPTRSLPSLSTTPERFLVVFLVDIAFAYPPSGACISFHLPFLLHKAWAMGRGVLLERAQDEHKRNMQGGFTEKAALYSLMHPSKEMTVVWESLIPPEITGEATVQRSEILSSFQDLRERVVSVSVPVDDGPAVIVSCNDESQTFGFWSYKNREDGEEPALESSNSQFDSSSGRNSALLAATSAAPRINQQSTISALRKIHHENDISLLSASLSAPTAAPALVNTSVHGVHSHTELLEALASPSIGVGTQRASSAVSDIPGAERRGSITRNELSITMDRMAIGVGSACADIDASATLHTLGVTTVDHRRKTYMRRICEIPFVEHIGAQTFRHCSSYIIDFRSGSGILCLLVPKLGVLLLWRIFDFKDNHFAVEFLQKIPAIAATPITGTRLHVLDLLVLTNDCKWGLIGAEGVYERVEGPDLTGMMVERLESNGFAEAVIVQANKTRQLISTMSGVSEVCLRLLEGLSAVLPLSAFNVVRQSMARWRSAHPGDSDTGCLAGALHGYSNNADQPSQNPWSELAREHALMESSDALLAGLRPSAVVNTATYKPQVTPCLNEAYLEAAIWSLHLNLEDMKLRADVNPDYTEASQVLLPLLLVLGSAPWIDYYREKMSGTAYLNLEPAVEHAPSPKFPSSPPDLLRALQHILKHGEASAEEDLIQTSIAANYGWKSSNFYGTSEVSSLSRNVISLYKILSDPAWPKDSLKKSSMVVLAMNDSGWSTNDINDLALGVSLPIREAMRVCQLSGPEGWPASAYQIIRRPDLAEQNGGIAVPHEEQSNEQVTGPPPSITQICDEMMKQEGTEVTLYTSKKVKPVSKYEATRFNEDKRLEEVERMLQFSEAIVTTAGDRSLDQLTTQVQQSILSALSHRTLALPAGFAIFKYKTALQIPEEGTTSIPPINLSARILPMSSHVALLDKETRDATGTIVNDRLEWPEFHSGVAIALAMDIDKNGYHSSQLSFHKPDTLNARHAGFLLGLGLSGHLSRMMFNQAFEYLKMKHDPTSIGLLLGLAANYLGTGDAKVTSLLSVHLSAFHPANSSPLNVSGITQAAGLVGMGLLYLGTARKSLADVMIQELCAVMVTPVEDPSACREAYALSAGFAFGFIMLGSAGKNSISTSSEVLLLRTFRALILGESSHSLAGVVPGQVVTDVNITSSAATMALALMYIRSERQDVAQMLEIPDTPRRLDYVRYDLLLLRTLARSIIMWDSIACSKAWIEGNVPSFIDETSLSTGASKKVDSDLAIARWNIIAGACYSVGLKYAGTAAAEAHATLIHYVDRLTRAAYVKASNVQSRIRRHAIRCCLNVVAMSLSMVMAGTGEINVLRRLRVAHGHFSEGVTYGTHLASHMALGLLFVGSGQYTLGTSNSAIAALLLAFYPSFPASSSGNRAHLQAYRHLWTLAIEPRCLQVIDVDTNEAVFLPIRLRMLENDKAMRSKHLVAPTLIPELRLIDSIHIDSPRYWGFGLNLAPGSFHQERIIRSGKIRVKRRTGHLSYAQDPRGIRSIFTRSKSETGSSVFDLGETAKMLIPSAAGLRGFVASFSKDLSSSAIVLHMCQSTFSKGRPSAYEAYLACVLLECLTSDKGEAVNLYHAIFHAQNQLQSTPASHPTQMSTQQLLLVIDFYYSGIYDKLFGSSSRSKSSSAKEPLIQRAFIEHIVQNVKDYERAACAEDDLAAAIEAYILHGVWPNSVRLGSLLSIYAKMYRFPDRAVILQLRDVAENLVATSKVDRDSAAALLRVHLRTTSKVLQANGGEGWSLEFDEYAVNVWMSSYDV